MIALTVAVLGPFTHTQDAGPAKRVLVLNSTRSDEQFSVVSEREVPKLLAAGLGAQVDYYTEYLDMLRFPQPDYQGVYLDFLRQKYAGRNFDLLILMGDTAIDFVSRHRSVFGRTPAVFYTPTPLRNRPANATGLINELHFKGSIDLALALQPNLERVYVVSGAGPSDRQYESRARAEFSLFDGRIDFTYLSGLVTKDLEERLRTLPSRSAVY